jgi:hypothetical protein
MEGQKQGMMINLNLNPTPANQTSSREKSKVFDLALSPEEAESEF